MTFLRVAADTAETASRTSGIEVALVGLGGVFIGALFGLAGTWMTTRQNARLTKQAELRRLYTEIFEQLGTSTVLQMTSVAIQETLAQFYQAMGSDTPTAKHVAMMSETNRPKYLKMTKMDDDNSMEILESTNRLEHLKYQAQLIAPADTALFVEARVSASHGSDVAGVVNTALVALGRRDLTSGTERRKAKRVVREIRRRDDLKSAMTDYEVFRIAQARNASNGGTRDASAEATDEVLGPLSPAN